MKAETLADYRTRIADRTLITLSVLSIERILDERLKLLAALHAARAWFAEEAADGTAGSDAWKMRDAADAALAYAEEPVP